jgi:hypothetical protein
MRLASREARFFYRSGSVPAGRNNKKIPAWVMGDELTE